MSVILGLAILLAGGILGWWLPKKIVPIFIEKKIVKETHGFDFPFHTLNNKSLRTFIGTAEPKIYPYLNDKLLSRINARIRGEHSLYIQAAVKGINTDAKMVDYLEKSGLLNEMKITSNEAIQSFKLIDCAMNKLTQEAGFARYNPISPPDLPVRLPAEFEPIGAVVLSFPIYYPLCWETHSEFIKQITSKASAFVIVPNECWQKAATLYLTQKNIRLESVKFLHFLTDDVWTRDYGPTTVLSGGNERPVFIWNPYYIIDQAYYKFDADATAALSMILDVPAYRLPMVIEGGNIITDGKGTMIMAESVLDINPDIDKERLEQIVKDYFGCSRLVTFPPLKGELTGHIDMLVKFVDEDALMVISSKKGYKWYDDFENMAKRLAQIKSVNGKNYTIVRVPMPEIDNSAYNFWSYVNSLTVNKKVIVPIFNVQEDKKALEIYKTAMPGYEIVGIDFHRYPVGSVHCQSKEIYKKVFNYASL